MKTLIKNISLFAVISILSSFLNLSISSGQENPEKVSPGKEDIKEDMNIEEENFYYFYGMWDMIDYEVDVASLFLEDELYVGSIVSSINARKWKQLGARRTIEALNNEMNVMTYPGMLGNYVIAMRGYTFTGAMTGIGYRIDDLTMNEIVSGGNHNMPNWELGTLDSIEVIKGPGSAIYGSYAFHGVIALKTFESNENHFSIETAGVGPNPQYFDGSVKLSRGFFEDLFRINIAFAASGQMNMNEEYEFYDYSTPNIKDKGKRDWRHLSQSGTIKFNANPADKFNVKLRLYFCSFQYDEYPGGGFDKNFNTLGHRDIHFGSADHYISQGILSYEFENKISIEAHSTYRIGSSTSNITVDSNKARLMLDSNGSGNGLSLKIKQPDNKYNLQWLIAYEYQFGNQNKAKVTLKDHPLITEEELTEPYENKERVLNGIYGQLKWGLINNTFFILAGGRIDHYNEFGFQYTPRGGLIFLPTKKSSVKALYGRGFRAPTLSELYGTKYITHGAGNLKPEIIDTYELAFIYKEERWKLVTNAFYNRWKNAILITLYQDSSSLEFLQHENKGSNYAYGFELNLFYSLMRFMIDFGFAYARSVANDAYRIDTSGNYSLNPDGSVYKKDTVYRGFPEYSINLGLHYNIELLGIDLYLNNRMYLNMTNVGPPSALRVKKLPPYYRLDLNICKRIKEKLEIILDIRNLLNRKNYITNVAGSETEFEEPGISAMLRVGYKL